ncbi:hypothetical protein TrST_g4217 [Triparma strigata]|uniref:Steroid 5-alpha reductase C-terminal domain-containing protein n=1 Tax=Triparma strigata TaxID=1606541 RepID=A0A9W6ZGY2_9STRA|nr:hypothetical protein TrST_g4217 [Triparma strigata]
MSVPAHSKLHYLVHASGPINGLVLFLAPPILKSFALQHGSVQLIWFIFSACIPSFFTNVMYWVDFAWPCGLAWIGLFVWWWTGVDDEYDTLRRKLICGAYLLHGARMGFGALVMIATGTWNWRVADLPRYQFQKIRVEQNGGSWNMLVMQKEILMQCMANSSILFLPCFLCAIDTTSDLSPVEIAGYATWILGWTLESVADGHKLAWSATPKEKRTAAFCSVGLWKYSRHPNYFGEWVAWNGLAIAAVHPMLRFGGEWGYGISGDVGKVGLSYMLLFISLSLYYCLSEWTGAVPAEYFSVQKRKGYDVYMQTTSMIIPWFVSAPGATVGGSGVVKRGRARSKPPKPTTNNNKRQTRTPSKGKKSQKSQARNDTPAYIRTISRTGRTATPSRKKMEALGFSPPPASAKVAGPTPRRSVRKRTINTPA